MTSSSGSSASSPNTKPEPRYHQCCCYTKSGFSGSSCASVPLPMPDSKQRSAKCLAKSSKIRSNFSTFPFHLRLALSGSILQYLPLMTGSSTSSASSPNTKPEPRYHQCCCYTKSGLSGSSCASVPLPMPDSKQRSAKCLVKSSKIRSNFSTFPFHLRLALSGSILPYLSAHDGFLSILTILTKHQA